MGVIPSRVFGGLRVESLDLCRLSGAAPQAKLSISSGLPLAPEVVLHRTALRLVRHDSKHVSVTQADTRLLRNGRAANMNSLVAHSGTPSKTPPITSVHSHSRMGRALTSSYSTLTTPVRQLTPSQMRRRSIGNAAMTNSLLRISASAISGE